MKKVHRIDLLRRAVNRNSMLYKILTSYIIIVVLGFTLFAAVLANAFMRNAEHEMQNTTNTMVMQSYNTADVLLKHNFTYYYDLFFEDSDMIRGLYTEDLSAKEDVEIYPYLQKAADNDVITDSIYLYNGTAGKIYSSIPGVYSLNSFYDQEIADIMKNQAEGKKGIYEPRLAFFITNPPSNLKRFNIRDMIWNADPDSVPRSACALYLNRNTAFHDCQQFFDEFCTFTYFTNISVTLWLNRQSCNYFNLFQFLVCQIPRFVLF